MDSLARRVTQVIRASRDLAVHRVRREAHRATADILDTLAGRDSQVRASLVTAEREPVGFRAIAVNPVLVGRVVFLVFPLHRVSLVSPAHRDGRVFREVAFRVTAALVD